MMGLAGGGRMLTDINGDPYTFPQVLPARSFIVVAFLCRTVAASFVYS